MQEHGRDPSIHGLGGTNLIGKSSVLTPAQVLRGVFVATVGLAVLAISSASGPVVTLNGKAPAPLAGAETTDFQFRLVAFGTDPLVDEFHGIDPVRTTDLEGTPYNQEVIDIPGWRLGRYRRQGPHLMATENPNLSLHMAELERDVPKVVPVDFTGLVVIDYEPWWALWERTPNKDSTGAVDALDGDYKDDWKDYVRSQRAYLLEGLSPEWEEHVYKRTYEAFVRTFLLATYYKCKQLRPRAQWSFYNYPQVLINSDLTGGGVKGYGDLSHQASRLNDEIQWFFDAVDFVSPRIYPVLKVPEQWPPAERLTGEISPSVHEAWLSSMIRESVRLGKGKPVYPMHAAIFFSPHPFALEPVSRYQHEEVYRILAENGAAGVIIWHAVRDREELTLWNQLWENELKPAGINSDRAINGPRGGSSGP